MAKKKDTMEEIAARLKAMEDEIEEARAKYEAEAAKVAKERVGLVAKAEKRRVKLLDELSKLDTFLRVVKKKPLRVVRKKVPSKPGGYMDVLAWIKKNYSVGREFSYSDVVKSSGYGHSAVWKALRRAGIAEGYFEVLSRGKYKYVSEIKS